MSTNLDDDYSLRGSYEYIGAYTTTALKRPDSLHQPHIPLMWDLGSKSPSGFNHIPGGSMVLWLDGSVTFVTASEFALTNLPYVPEDVDLSPIGPAISNDYF